MMGDFPPYLPPIPFPPSKPPHIPPARETFAVFAMLFCLPPFPPFLSKQWINHSLPRIYCPKKDDAIHNDCLRRWKRRRGKRGGLCASGIVYGTGFDKTNRRKLFSDAVQKKWNVCIAHLHKHCKTLLPSTKKIGTIKTLLWGEMDGFFSSLFGLLLSFLSPFLLRIQDYWKETETHDEPRPWLSRKKGSEKDTNALFPD